ncbi:MAG: hypothetical protein ACTTH8_05165 [Treponema sp.]
MCVIKKSLFFFLFIITVHTVVCEEHFSFHVDAQSARSREKGTESAPFKTLEDAVDSLTRLYHKGILKNKKLSIYLHSNIRADEAVLLSIPVTIVGLDGAVLTFGDNAGFVVYNTDVQLEALHIRRSEYYAEPRSVPLLYAVKGSVTLQTAELHGIEGGDVVILHNASLFCKNSVMRSSQSAQSVIISAKNSRMIVENTQLFSLGLTAAAFLLLESECTLVQVQCELTPEHGGYAAVLKNTRFEATDCTFSCAKGRSIAEQTAISCDADSQVVLHTPPVLSGFVQTVVRE